MEEKLQGLLQDLRTKIGEAISGSEAVARKMGELHKEGYAVSMVLDLTIGLESEDGQPQAPPPETAGSAGFDVSEVDVKLLRELGMDPTRKVRPKRQP
jgi:hypothetical protein